jgi:hypothetical protein
MITLVFERVKNLCNQPEDAALALQVVLAVQVGHVVASSSCTARKHLADICPNLFLVPVSDGKTLTRLLNATACRQAASRRDLHTEIMSNHSTSFSPDANVGKLKMTWNLYKMNRQS